MTTEVKATLAPECAAYRDNLLKLADYLETIPAWAYDHRQFGESAVGDWPCCALGHAYSSRLFPGMGLPHRTSADCTFGPGAYDAIFSTYDPDVYDELFSIGPPDADECRNWTRDATVRAIRGFVAENYPAPDVYPAPMWLYWERAKQAVTRILARVLRPLG